MKPDGNPLKILRILAGAPDGLTPTEIALQESIKVPRKDVGVYVLALLKTGLIDRTPSLAGNLRTFCYFLTPRGREAVQREGGAPVAVVTPIRSAPAPRPPEVEPPDVDALQELLDRKRKRPATTAPAVEPFASGVFHDDSMVIQQDGTTLVLAPENARKLAKVCIRHFRPDLLDEISPATAVGTAPARRLGAGLSQGTPGTPAAATAKPGRLG